MVRLQEKLPFLVRRREIKYLIRQFFDSRGYFEVETPYLVPTPGEEVHLYPFKTEYETPYGEKETLFLHTSPEFAMKKILAQLHQPIYQFARVWRNGEGGSTHSPEFTMLEWYHPNYNLSLLMDETENLLKSILPSELQFRHITLRLNSPFERITVNQAFQHYVGVDLLSLPEDPAILARAANVALRPSETWEDLFTRILLEKVEPFIGIERPTFLTHWPVSQAALAKIDPFDSRVALRFELYARGLELANAFEELTDAEEQRQRFIKDRQYREKLYPNRPQWKIDEKFLSSLFALPPCAGIALGFDRLVMLATGSDKISDVIWT